MTHSCTPHSFIHYAIQIHIVERRERRPMDLLISEPLLVPEPHEGCTRTYTAGAGAWSARAARASAVSVAAASHDAYDSNAGVSRNCLIEQTVIDAERNGPSLVFRGECRRKIDIRQLIPEAFYTSPPPQHATLPRAEKSSQLCVWVSSEHGRKWIRRPAWFLRLAPRHLAAGGWSFEQVLHQ